MALAAISLRISLDGDLQAGGDRRRTLTGSPSRLRDGVSMGRSEAEDGGAKISWLARNGRHAQGKKVLRRRCGQTIEAKPTFGQIKPLRGRVVRA